ncbi:MAG TPA: hypothetical protein VGB22_07155 [candidate division Zixibacteria bacterium]|jgi:hypothetical protein
MRLPNSWRRFAVLLVVAACGMWAAGSAMADVTIKQTIRSEGMGGLFNTEITTETYIQADKQCTVTETDMKSKILGGLVGGGKPVKTTRIERLDEGNVYDIDHERKTVRVTPISEIKENKSSLFGGQGMGEDGKSDDQGFDTSKFKMEKPKLTVAKTGKTGTYAGYDCTESRVEMEVNGVNTETGGKVRFRVVMDLMLSEDVPGMDEQAAFARAYAEATGLEEYSGANSAEVMAEALTQYGFESDEFAKFAADLKGSPLHTRMNLFAEGEGMGMSGEDGDAEQDAKMAEAMKMMEKFMGGDDKSDKKSDDETEPQSGDEGAMMTFIAEVTEISTGGITPDHFTPDSKLKKVK